MATIETIKSDGTGDYTSPQAWYDAHKGDITSDPNAPYIGELNGEEFATFTDMYGSTTDSSHYFHLRAMSGAEFKGDFAALGVATIKGDTNGYFLTVEDNYTRIEHILFGKSSFTDKQPFCIFVSGGSSNVIIDSCGVYSITTTATSSTRYIIGIGVSVSSSDTIVRNCMVGDLKGINNGGNTEIGGIIMHIGKLYNCSVVLSDSDSSIVGIWGENSSTIIKNCVSTVPSSETAFYFDTFHPPIHDYNASSDSTATGAHSITNINPTDEFIDTNPSTMDLHLKSTSQLIGIGVNLSSEFTEDIDNETIIGDWSIGADWFNPNVIIIPSTLEVPSSFLEGNIFYDYLLTLNINNIASQITSVNLKYDMKFLISLLNIISNTLDTDLLINTSSNLPINIQNIDSMLQSLSVKEGCGVSLNNIPLLSNLLSPNVFSKVILQLLSEEIISNTLEPTELYDYEDIGLRIYDGTQTIAIAVKEIEE